MENRFIFQVHEGHALTRNIETKNSAVTAETKGGNILQVS